MKVINKTVAAQLKKNYKRSLTTVFGISVAVAMLTSVAVCFKAAFGFASDLAAITTGTWNTEFTNVDPGTIESLTNDKDLEQYVVEKRWPVAMIDYFAKKSNKPGESFVGEVYGLRTLSKGASELNLGGKLVAGSWPESSDQIALPEGMGDYKLGDKVCITYGDDMDDDESLKTQVFVVTGFLDTKFRRGLVSYLDEKSLATTDEVDIYLKFSNFNYSKSRQLDEQTGEGMYPNIFYNLNFEAKSWRFWFDLLRKKEDLTMMRSSVFVILGLGAFLVCVIVAAAIGMIYSAFSLSLTERLKYLGVLASVGATRWQKFKSMFFEAFALGSFGIVLGLLVGSAGIGLTFYLLKPMIITVVGLPIYLKFGISAGLVAAIVLLSVFAILISAIWPAIKSSRVTAMDAIGQTKEIKLTRKRVKTPRWVQKAFKTEGELALKNLKRNKSKYRIILLSLSTNLAVFIMAAAFVKAFCSFAVRPEQENSVDITASVRVSCYDDAQRKDNWGAVELKELLQTKKSLQEANPGLKCLYADVNCSMEPKAEIMGQSSVVEAFPVYAYGDKEKLARAIERKDTKIELSALDDGDQPVFIAVGGQIPEEEKVLPGAKVIKADADSQGGWVRYYCTVESLARFLDQNTTVRVWGLNCDLGFKVSPGDNEAEKKISAAFEGLNDKLPGCNTGCIVQNVGEIAKKEKIVGIIALVFAAGFYGLILLICVTNVFNTLSTNVILRRREFAVLKSVGLEDKGIKRILNYETLFYGAKTLLFGLPVGVLLVLLVAPHDIPQGSLGDMLSYIWSAAVEFLPWTSILAASIAVFVIIKIPMVYARKELEKDSIIDAIKKENI